MLRFNRSLSIHGEKRRPQLTTHLVGVIITGITETDLQLIIHWQSSTLINTVAYSNFSDDYAHGVCYCISDIHVMRNFGGKTLLRLFFS